MPEKKQESASASNAPSASKNLKTRLKTPEGKKEDTENVIIRYLRLKRGLRLPAMLALFVLMLVGAGGLAYLCWVRWLPSLWNWGFNPISWRAIFSVLGAIYLVIIPLMPFTLFSTIGAIFELSIAEQEEETLGEFTRFSQSQKSIEDDVEKNDSAGLITLIRWSRLQLEEYYKSGLSQHRRSFRYSIIAMWIGFIVIIAGVAIHVLPFGFMESLRVSGVREVTIAGGTVIEIISALFLWVYRSSENQQKYFYEQQMYIYSVLMCQRIAETMEKPDETKRLIVEKILEGRQKVEHNRMRIPGIGKIAG